MAQSVWMEYADRLSLELARTATCTPPLRRWTSVLALLALTSFHAGAQSAPVFGKRLALRLVDSLGVGLELTEVTSIAASDDGGFLVTQPRDGLVLRLLKDGSRIALTTPGDGPGETRVPVALGRCGARYWTYDASHRRITWIDGERREVAQLADLVDAAGATSVVARRFLAFLCDSSLVSSSQLGYASAIRAEQQYGLVYRERRGRESEAVGRLPTYQETVHLFAGPQMQSFSELPGLRSVPRLGISPQGQVVVSIEPTTEESRGLRRHDVVRTLTRASRTDTASLWLPTVRREAGDKVLAERLLLQRFAASNPQLRAAWERAVRDSVRVPPSLASLSKVLVADGGDLMVRVNPEWREQQQWVLLDSQLRPRGFLELPRAVRPLLFTGNAFVAVRMEEESRLFSYVVGDR